MSDNNNNDSVFTQLGFAEEDADNLSIRSEMMSIIASYIRDENLLQKEAAKIFEISQPRVSDLIRGKISLFTVDTLIIMLNKIDFRVSISVELVDRKNHFPKKPISCASKRSE